MSRLESIAARQRTTRVRDALFALCVAAASVLSLTAASSVCHAATPFAAITR